ncbi:methionyl-tRNA formyltransferase isoform X2 [Dioscorea cayenensis subsp. rotundata]|uniref:Methionyl-tRNA formyltransferase, mitochondrial n=1 Tax=Dioscorea cayennensis subsp. rotundata TaxID=55577 RepID=A0AB40CWZ8_DIOCR|nr:methionyl-tRNA formyltransferase isoform X2 [Dioscorea cayenensis subsp. rotundata]
MAPSVPALRRLLSCFAGGGNGAPSALEPATKKKNLVFMGSPQVSASVLGALLDASTATNSSFQVAAIVTQPPSTRDRGRKLMPSAVAQYALDWGFPRDLILTPDRTGDENFLGNFRALNPELCVTAAYGNILPNKFLEIPPYGTVNIHPSLLPLYRGAAPVQRALQDGVKETGVSLAFTVRALDAGPIIACERVEVDDCIKAPELLTFLFDLGSKILIHELPSIFDGSAKLKAKAQDDSKATLAPKLTSDESWLSFDQEAKILHNKVRAFAGWPGTRARIQVIDSNGNPNTLEIKIITTRVSSAYERQGEADEITFVGSAMVIPCAEQSALEVLELQLPGKKVMTARDLRNGLQGQKLRRLI